jgi:predicted metal-binding protein
MKHVPARWQGAVLVCARCQKRSNARFGPDRRPLAKALARALGGGRKRKAAFGVVPVKCLGLCPRAGVVVVDTARPDDWLVVEAGHDLDALAARLRDGRR